MRPIRLALPLVLLLGPALAQSQPGPQSHPIPAPPPVPPAPPRPPSPPPPPEIVAAARAAREGEAWIVLRRYDDAIAHFRRTVESAPAGREVYRVTAIHAFGLGRGLIDAGRLADAERELAWFVARAPADVAGAGMMLQLNELQLYLAAGRGDGDRVLALLDVRTPLAGTLSGGCPTGDYFPIVVAPAHHDPRVAAKLRALGCWQSIIDQLDELASRPIGANMFDRGLPPRRPPPGG